MGSFSGCISFRVLTPWSFGAIIYDNVEFAGSWLVIHLGNIGAVVMMSKRTVKRRKVTGREKAAILLLMGSPETADEVCAQLTQSEIQQITRTVTEMDFVTEDLASEVATEFCYALLGRKIPHRGGPAAAHRFLQDTFGREDTPDTSETSTGDSIQSRLFGYRDIPDAAVRGYRLPILF